MNISVIGSSHSVIDLRDKDLTKLKFKDYSVLGHQDYMSIINNGPKIITDGCSGSVDSVVGVRLFHQFFKALPNKTSLKHFEDNVTEVFEKLIDVCSEPFKEFKDAEPSLMSRNLLFTIIALFETEEEFVVKMLGDGYIITENLVSQISYIGINHNNRPPYKAYDYMIEQMQDPIDLERQQFKTFMFSKKLYKSVGIASDGIATATENNISFDDLQKFDRWLLNHENLPEVMAFNRINTFIKNNHKWFYDDTTIMFKEETGTYEC